MKKIILIGDRPDSKMTSGRMLGCILDSIDEEKYAIHCFIPQKGCSMLPSTFEMVAEPENIHVKLLDVLRTNPIDIVVLIGANPQIFKNIFPQIDSLRRERGFRVVVIAGKRGRPPKTSEWETIKINEILTDIDEEDARQDKILFMQEASAGDILMTTRCFKGLVERHKMPLVYMTQRRYWDILKENPLISEIVNWDISQVNNYKHVYSPHRDRVLGGQWGRGSILLSDLYWKLVRVQPDNFFIHLNEPPTDYKLDEEPFHVIHTTGGDHRLRVYKHMNIVVQNLKFRTIQLGSMDDYPAKVDLDLRGKLSFRETAWVMSKARSAIVVDSFLSHLAGALGVSQVCLFGPGNVANVRPVQTKGLLICRVPDYLNDCHTLAPCSGHMRKCSDPCINLLTPEQILSDVQKIEEFLGKEAKK